MKKLLCAVIAGSALVVAPVTAASAATPRPAQSSAAAAPSAADLATPRLDRVLIVGDQVRAAHVRLVGATPGAFYQAHNMTANEFSTTQKIGEHGIISFYINLEPGVVNHVELYYFGGPDNSEMTIPLDIDDTRTNLQPNVKVEEDTAKKQATVRVSGIEGASIVIYDADDRVVGRGVLSEKEKTFVLPLPSREAHYTVTQRHLVATSEPVPFVLSAGVGGELTAPALSVRALSANRAVVDATGVPGGVVTIESENGRSIKMVGRSGTVQVPIAVEAGHDEMLTAKQTVAGSTSAEASVEAVPSPVVETVWRGKDRAIVRVAKQAGQLEIVDGNGKRVALRTFDQKDDILVQIPLASEKNHFTATRTTFENGASLPTAFDVATGTETLAAPTAELAGTAGHPMIRMKAQPGASVAIREIGGHDWDYLTAAGLDGTAWQRDVTRGATSVIEQRVGSTVSAQTTITIPTTAS